MKDIELSYTLIGHGWAECEIEIYGLSCILIVSYLSNALHDLIDAVNYILNSEYDINFCFIEEPGENRWVLRPEDKKNLHIKIIAFPQIWSNKADEEGELIFEANVSKYDFSLAVLEMLENLLSEQTLLEYEAQWGSSFPVKEYRHLCFNLGRKPIEHLLKK
jgi:hypothetical protein